MRRGGFRNDIDRNRLRRATTWVTHIRCADRGAQSVDCIHHCLDAFKNRARACPPSDEEREHPATPLGRFLRPGPSTLPAGCRNRRSTPLSVAEMLPAPVPPLGRLRSPQARRRSTCRSASHSPVNLDRIVAGGCCAPGRKSLRAYCICDGISLSFRPSHVQPGTRGLSCDCRSETASLTPTGVSSRAAER